MLEGTQDSDLFRTLEKTHAGRETQDGAGVRLTRIIGQSLHRRLDPFLMLDHFQSDDPDDYIKGFPSHPHRGFETLTLLHEGRMRHRDNRGHEGIIESGGVQWMLAGRGIIHSEMPEQQNGRLEGFQLWINLPGTLKMSTPEYRDLPDHEIPEIFQGDSRIRVIMGQLQGHEGAIQRPKTEPQVFDLRIPEGGEVCLSLSSGQHAALYPSSGELQIEGTPLPCRHLGILSNHGKMVRIQARSKARVLFIAGTPLEEPIFAHGPFVMNTEKEIHEAITDYQSGRFG